MNAVKLNGGTASLAIAATGACLVGGVVGGLLIKTLASSRPPEDKMPEKWVRMGEVRELLIFPVKSLQGISVQEAVLGKMGLIGADNGLLRDRVFLVVDKDGIGMSQKKIPKLALLGVRIDGSRITLFHSKDSSLEVTIDIPTNNNTPTKTAKVMGEDIRGVVDCGDEIASWLERVTGTAPLRLVYHAMEQSVRGSVNRNSRFHTYRPSHTPAFQDETSYMLMTDESVAAVNAHLGDKPISHKNFRPTIVAGGVPEPFCEDFWGFVRFGGRDNGPVLKTSIPCQRCKLTTVDTETGEFRDDGEPLRTLYRLKRPVGDEKVSKLVSKSAVIGTHFGVFEGEGALVRVGDPIYVALL